VYGAAKRAACLALEALAKQEGRELVWARIFHVHGPGDAPSRLIPSVVSRLARGEPIDLTDGAQKRDHLHVADLGAALAALVDADVAGVVNVCSGEPVTLREVVEAAAAAVGRPDLLRFGARPRHPDELAYLAGDGSRLRATGWRPRFGLVDGIADAVAWQLSQSHV
jgi:nucleoside-diphosphate-sugar epimerase